MLLKGIIGHRREIVVVPQPHICAERHLAVDVLMVRQMPDINVTLLEV